LLPSAVLAVLCPIKSFSVVVLSCQVSLQLNYRVRCIFMDGNFSDQQKTKHWLNNLAFWFRKKRAIHHRIWHFALKHGVYIYLDLLWDRTSVEGDVRSLIGSILFFFFNW
jgi:hypothetical protein